MWAAALAAALLLQPAAGAPAPPTCPAALHNATECHGPQIGSLGVGGVLAACCGSCERTPGCGAFTFAPGHGGTDCWLHGGGQACALQAAEGRVGGVLLAGGLPDAARRLRARAFNLSAVRLVADAGNQFAAAQALNTEFLEYLDPDRFLVAWRMVAQLQPHGLNGAVVRLPHPPRTHTQTTRLRICP